MDSKGGNTNMRRLLFRGLVIGLFLFGFVVMANASLI